MQPLFAHQNVLLIVMIVSLLIWRVVESSVDILSFRRLRAGARRQDRGSLVILSVFLAGGAFLAAVVAFAVPVGAILFARSFIFWLGIVLIYAGIAFRLYAIMTLGAFFTTSVAVAPAQTVIDTGPYRLIRHPAYTGVLITLLGFGLCLTNWLSLLILTGCALISFWYRIQVEERVLQAQLGQQYQEYMRHTKRLIPFVL